MKITLADLGAVGLMSDAQPQELPPNAWTAARNVVFREGYVQRVSGQTQFSNTPSITPYWLQPYQTASARFWVHAGTAAVYVDDGATLTDITGTAPTGAQDNRWTGGVLNGVLIMNNGVDDPMYWGGNVASNLATLTGWDTTWAAASIRPFKNHLIALDVTKGAARYPHMVKTSAAAEPGTIPTSWDEADPALDTYENDLAETPDVLIDSLPLGDALIIYKERAMYSFQYIGGSDIWLPRRLPGDIGMIARGCGVQTPMGHVVLAPGDVILHSGQGPRSLLTGRMRRALFNRLDSTYYARSFVTANPERNEVWICIPEAGQTTCSIALVWNWETDAIGWRDLQNVTYGAFGQVNYSAGNTWDSDSDSWDSDSSAWDANEYSAAASRLLFSQSTPRISLVDTGSTFNGTAMTAYCERIGHTFGDAARVKLITSIVPRIEAPNGTVLTISVGGAMDAERAPNYSSSFTYTVGSSRKADVFASGRFLAIKISSTSEAPWRLRSMDVEVEPMGEY